MVQGLPDDEAVVLLPHSGGICSRREYGPFGTVRAMQLLWDLPSARLLCRANSSSDGESGAAKRWQMHRPRITYSIRKQDVQGAEAMRLLQAATPRSMAAGSASPLVHQQFAYWQPSGSQPKQVEKMTTALHHSLAVAAAYASLDVYAQPHASSSGHDAPASSGSNGSGGSGWQLPSWAGPRSHAPQTLVGLARASGDASLTASLYDVAVHPRMRGFGIGKQLVHMLVRQLHSRGIYDIGAVISPDVAPFFARCSFSTDPLQSTYMIYTGPSSRGVAMDDDCQGETQGEGRGQDGSVFGQLRGTGQTGMSPAGPGPGASAWQRGIVIDSLGCLEGWDVVGEEGGHTVAGAAPSVSVSGAWPGASRPSLQRLLQRKLSEALLLDVKRRGARAGGAQRQGTGARGQAMPERSVSQSPADAQHTHDYDI